MQFLMEKKYTTFIFFSIELWKSPPNLAGLVSLLHLCLFLDKCSIAKWYIYLLEFYILELARI